MASLFAESVLKRLRKLDRGEPKVICDEYDGDNFGNAVVTIELDGLRLHVVNDRGIETVEVGYRCTRPIAPLEAFVDGQGEPVCPLEVVAVVLGWVSREMLISHYWPVHAGPNYETDPPPGPFCRFDEESTRRQMQEHWNELTEFSESRELQLKAGDVERQLQGRLLEQLGRNRQPQVR